MEWLNDIRYDRPGLFYSAFAAAALFVGGLVFFALPESEFLRAVGITGAQKRAVALQRSAYWQVRATVHASADDTAPNVLYGHLLGITQDATLIASIPVGESFQERRFRLADVVVTDVQAAAVAISEVRLVPVKFDVYGKDQAVVWVNREPLNVHLIERRAAAPDPNPPTNIVDAAFARHYWAIFKGGYK